MRARRVCWLAVVASLLALPWVLTQALGWQWSTANPLYSVFLLAMGGLIGMIWGIDKTLTLADERNRLRQACEDLSAVSDFFRYGVTSARVQNEAQAVVLWSRAQKELPTLDTSYLHDARMQ